jgi:AcrR family transcriptional regulator
MSPRPHVSDERKSQILAAAMAVFARLGLDQARMDDIVAEAGLSKGALYWYFSSKEDIILASLEVLVQRDVAALQALVEAPGPARPRLLALAEHLASELKAMTHLAPILYEFYALAFRNPAVRQALQTDLRRYVTLAVPLFQQGIDRGEFQPVDAQQAANALAAIIEGTLLLWVFDHAALDLEPQIATSVGFLLDGLQHPAP